MQSRKWKDQYRKGIPPPQKKMSRNSVSAGREEEGECQQREAPVEFNIKNIYSKFSVYLRLLSEFIPKNSTNPSSGAAVADSR